MNNLDKQYTDLLQDILSNGITKTDRTGVGTKSLFGKQILHKMSEGFPLITTKKMYWKGIVAELLWFLKGDTNIKYLIDNDCHIWDGDAYKNYITWWHKTYPNTAGMTQKMFVENIKTDDEFAKKWGELGPIYGKQWRSWAKFSEKVYTRQVREVPKGGRFAQTRNVNWVGGSEVIYIDQIANLINDLKTNPDSRRLMVNAWNVGELDQMVLPPCHYGFQVYTRELSNSERRILYLEEWKRAWGNATVQFDKNCMDNTNIPTRAISLMWNQRSVDTFLGLPFNIASYGLLLEILAKEVNMVPDELIGNLGDTHLYLNHLDQVKEQITREPFELPKLIISETLYEHGNPYPERLKLDSYSIYNFELENYVSHPAIKAPLNN
jgi:thymidylate synthase